MAEPDEARPVRYVRDWDAARDSRLTRGRSLWRDAEGLVWLTPAEVQSLRLTTAMREAVMDPSLRAPEQEARTEAPRAPSEGDDRAVSAEDWFKGSSTAEGDAQRAAEAVEAFRATEDWFGGDVVRAYEESAGVRSLWALATAALDPYWECLGWPVGPHADGSGSPGAPDGPHAYHEVPEGAACDLCGLTRDDPRARRNVEELNEGTLAAWAAGQQRVRRANGPTPTGATTDEAALDAAGLDAPLPPDGMTIQAFPPSGETEGWRWWWAVDEAAPGGRLLAYDNRPLVQAWDRGPEDVDVPLPGESVMWKSGRGPDRRGPRPALVQGAVPVAVLRAAMLATWPEDRCARCGLGYSKGSGGIAHGPGFCIDRRGDGPTLEDRARKDAGA